MKNAAPTIIKVQNVLNKKISPELKYLEIREFFMKRHPTRKCIDKYTLLDIEEQMVEHTGVSIEHMGVPSQKRKDVMPRYMAYYKSYFLTTCSLFEIGFIFGKKDHATVLHGVKTIQNLLDTDREFRKKHQYFLIT